MNGSLNKTAKRKLLQELERHGSNYPALPPEEKVTSWIIDGMVLLQMLGHRKGWHLEDDIFVPTLIEREAAPNTLVEFTACGCQEGCSRSCKCQKEDLPCTEACFCGAEEGCRNPFSVQFIVEHESDSDSDSDSDGENFEGDDE